MPWQPCPPLTVYHASDRRNQRDKSCRVLLKTHNRWRAVNSGTKTETCKEKGPNEDVVNISSRANNQRGTDQNSFKKQAGASGSREETNRWAGGWNKGTQQVGQKATMNREETGGERWRRQRRTGTCMHAGTWGRWLLMEGVEAQTGRKQTERSPSCFYFFFCGRNRK